MKYRLDLPPPPPPSNSGEQRLIGIPYKKCTVTILNPVVTVTLYIDFMHSGL